jgi:hypothetical protein
MSSHCFSPACCVSWAKADLTRKGRGTASRGVAGIGAGIPAVLLAALVLGAYSPAAFPQEADRAVAAGAAPPVTEAQEDESRRGRFLALPIFVTEPAVGEGLGVGLVYFHGGPNPDQTRVSTARQIGKTGRRQKPPPTATGVFGLYTSNETAGAGIGHSRTLNEDRYRLTGAAAEARINATYYLGDLPFDFSVAGELLYGVFKRRVADSNWFIGLSASIVNADAEFDIDFFDPRDFGLLNFSFTDVGMAGTAIYDSRDDSMMPSSGQLVDFTVWRYDDAIGGDFNYWTARIKANSFHELGERVVLGARFEAGTAEGSVPFYAEPYVPLRGIPALRYQGEVAGVVEVEGRFNFARRWSALAFAGLGFVAARTPEVESQDDLRAFGAGIRFLALKEQNVWVGLDIARGPEDYAWYIQMAHPW